MKKDAKESTGIQLLVKRYKKIFRIPENLRYYSQKDYKTAEKKFLYYAVLGRKV
jgi:hypothetical protein